jgi:hypothetical protein
MSQKTRCHKLKPNLNFITWLNYFPALTILSFFVFWVALAYFSFDCQFSFKYYANSVPNLICSEPRYDPSFDSLIPNDCH